MQYSGHWSRLLDSREKCSGHTPSVHNTAAACLSCENRWTQVQWYGHRSSAMGTAGAWLSCNNRPDTRAVFLTRDKSSGHATSAHRVSRLVFGIEC